MKTDYEIKESKIQEKEEQIKVLEEEKKEESDITQKSYINEEIEVLEKEISILEE